MDTNGNERPGALRSLRWLALGLAIATFALTVLGAVVRAMDAGLACPDWPLCHGQYFPPFDPVLSGPGPVPTPAQMNAEWLHRVLAAVVSAGMVALGIAVARVRNHRIRRYTWIAFGLLALQVLMGAATVFLGNVHYSVAVHLGLAAALLMVLTWIARLAAPDAWRDVLRRASLPAAYRRQGAIASAALAALLIIGALVATTGADLICLGFPTCGRDDYTGVGGLVFLQMLHRLMAFGFLAWSLYVTVAVRHLGPAVWIARLVSAVTLLQVTLGALNVFWFVPVSVSAAHLAAGVALFIIVVHWSAVPAEVTGRVPLGRFRR